MLKYFFPAVSTRIMSPLPINSGTMIWRPVSSFASFHDVVDPVREDGAVSTTSTLPSKISGLPVTSIEDGAFEFCASLTAIIIGTSVTNIGELAFYHCTGLTGVYFKVNAPTAVSPLFNGDDNVTVYYLPGTTGWDTPLAGLPPVLWNAQVQTGRIREFLVKRGG